MEKWEIDLLKERRETEYWIDPRGKKVKWKGTLRELDNYASTHFLIALQYYPDSKTPEDVLFELNWIMIGAAAYGTRIKGEPTQAQLNTLAEIGKRSITDSYGVTYEIIKSE